MVLAPHGFPKRPPAAGCWCHPAALCCFFAALCCTSAAVLLQCCCRSPVARPPSRAALGSRARWRGLVEGRVPFPFPTRASGAFFLSCPALLPFIHPSLCPSSPALTIWVVVSLPRSSSSSSSSPSSSSSFSSTRHPSLASLVPVALSSLIIFFFYLPNRLPA